MRSVNAPAPSARRNVSGRGRRQQRHLHAQGPGGLEGAGAVQAPRHPAAGRLQQLLGALAAFWPAASASKKVMTSSQ